MSEFKYITLSYRVFLVVFVVVFSSCKKQRAKTPVNEEIVIVSDSLVTDSMAVETPVEAPIKNTVDTEVDEIKINEIDFLYFSSNSKLRYKTATENQNAQINFRIKKDSLIWFSISGFGIEAVRGIITRDSLFAIDKLHREYYKFDFISLGSNFNFDLNFDILQSLVLGNLPLKKKGKNKFVVRENDYYLLHQEDGEVLIDNYIGEQNRKLKKLTLSKEEQVQNKLTMTFDDFQTINEHIFPYESLIKVDYQSTKDQKFYETLIELKHKKVEFTTEPLGFPFTIPPNYTPKN
ncbi:MAG: DUF4292 domain-containing protein [Bacteroidota bacterium]